MALRSRLFAFLNQDENTGVFAPPPGRYLHDSGPFPAPPRQAGGKKKAPARIQLNEDPRMAAKWKTGKIPAYRPPLEDSGFPWLKGLLWLLVGAILLQAYWIFRH